VSNCPCKDPAVRLVTSDFEHLDTALKLLDVAGNDSDGFEQLSDLGQALTYVACELRNIEMRAQMMTLTNYNVLTVVANHLDFLTLPPRYKFLLEPVIKVQISRIYTKQVSILLLELITELLAEKRVSSSVAAEVECVE
jgi:hypothetical protein